MQTIDHSQAQRANSVEDQLVHNFGKVTPTNTGFKFNKQYLTTADIKVLSRLPVGTDTTVKRSGTGLAIIVDL